ncbi:unnamed protein product [Arabidopsis halleri]
MALTSPCYPASARVDIGRYTTLGMIKRPRVVSVSAAKYPGIFAQILEKTKSVQVSTVLTTATSMAETAMMARSLVRNYVPHEVRHYISYELRCFFRRRFVRDFSSQITIIIKEYEGFDNNEVFEAAEAYLTTKISPSNKKLKVSKHDKEKDYNVTVERGEEVVDTFNGVQFRWVLHCRPVESKNSRNQPSEVRSFELSFHKKFKDMALESYLPNIVKRATSMKQEKKTLKLFTLDTDYWYSSDPWTSVTLDHPSTFKTLAMDLDVKRSIEEHELFTEIEESIKATDVSPADVAEQLMRNDSVDKILEGLIEFLEVKKIKNEQDKAKTVVHDPDNKETDSEKKKKNKGKDSEVKQKRRG